MPAVITGVTEGESMNLLAVSLGEILSDVGLTTVIGLVVVFFVLVLLTAIFKVFGTVMSRGEKASQSVREPAPVAPVAAAPMVGNTQTVSSTPEVSNSIPPETVAVVSAAVACMAPAGKQYVVRGIHKR